MGISLALLSLHASLMGFAPSIQIVKVSEPWCLPCNQWEKYEVPKLRKVGWRVGRSRNNHIRVMGAKEFSRQYGHLPGSVPSFYIIINGKVAFDRVRIGYASDTSARSLAIWWNRTYSREFQKGQSPVRSSVSVDRPAAFDLVSFLYGGYHSYVLHE